ncbi:MAG TPA: protoporphyrinogen oxidase [Thermoleophilia bacterium]|nr:protoporphyrinogen oxidase [Thermoleophilia bacterium]
MSKPLRIAIVGGGMAGLGAARVLEDARAADPSVNWHLYEDERRFGGKVHTVRREGFVVEGGPDSAIIEKPWPIKLARELGIGDQFAESNEDIRKSFVYARGRLHELPEGIILMVPTRMVPFALSSLMSWPGKLRMGMDLVLPRGGAAVSGAADESLGDFVRRRLGREALARIAEPIVAGIHAGDPEQMSVRATFPMFLDMEQQHRSLILAMLRRRKARQKAAAARDGAAGRVATGGAAAAGPRSYFYSFKGGLQDLSDAVVASLPAERLHGGAAVKAMAPCGAGCGTSGAGSGAYALQLADGTRLVADAVVLATPAWASGELLRAVAPLPAAGLASIEYVTTATVSVAFRRDQVEHDLKGFGFVVPRAEGRPVMATTWSSSKFQGRAPDGHVLLRSFLGRAGIEAAAQLDDEEMTKVVRAELRQIMGISAEPELVQIFRWPKGMPQYRVGHVALVEKIEAGVAEVPGVELAGGAYHGIGIGDCLREGAAAAERALEHVRGLPEDAVPPQPDDVPAADGVVD